MKFQMIIIMSLVFLVVKETIALEPFFTLEMIGPEGVVYNASENCYYVTDATEGKIFRIDEEKNDSLLVDGLTGIMMPLIADNNLYVTANDPNKVLKFNMENWELDYEFLLPNNNVFGVGGITYVDSENSIYVSTQQGGLFKINLGTNIVDTVEASPSGHGIVYDEENHRLIIVKSGSKVIEYNLTTNSYSTLSNTSSEYYTAISKTDDSYFLSAWSNKVFMYDKDFIDGDELSLDGLSNPVGSYYNEVTDELSICNYSNLTVGNISFYHLSSLDIENNYELSIMNYELKQNFPNPFNPHTRINYTSAPLSVNQLVEIVVYNAKGQKVWSSPITDHALRVTGSILFDGSKFNSGIYYYSLVVDNKVIQTKSMILIK